MKLQIKWSDLFVENSSTVDDPSPKNLSAKELFSTNKSDHFIRSFIHAYPHLPHCGSVEFHTFHTVEVWNSTPSTLWKCGNPHLPHLSTLFHTTLESIISKTKTQIKKHSIGSVVLFTGYRMRCLDLFYVAACSLQLLPADHTDSKETRLWAKNAPEIGVRLVGQKF